MVNGIEIRDYCGDFEDVAELTCRVWTAAYHDKIWFFLWDAAFLRWQLRAQCGALCPVAYHGTKLVGGFFSSVRSLRIGASVLPVALSSWFAVDPAYRRVALTLIETLRQRHEERGIAFSIGVMSGDSSSLAYRFWTKYAHTFPQRMNFLFPLGFWIKVLAPHRVQRAGVNVWERLGSRALGPLLRLTPPGSSMSVRPYRAEDLNRCAQLIERASAGLEWALVWSLEQLANQLESPVSGTLVFEREGRVQGLVNYHFITLYGREPLRTAVVDLWADDDLTNAQRVRLLARLCNDLRKRDVHFVMALRSAMMPAAAFAANVFLPGPSQGHMTALLTRSGPPLSPPKTWSLVMR